MSRPHIVRLTPDQIVALPEFFLERPDILLKEHYTHSRSPFDNLQHYMWEEAHEGHHSVLHQSLHATGGLTDRELLVWIGEELLEHGTEEQD